VNPRNTPRECPIHYAEIIYNRRTGVCPKGGERRNRDAVSVVNLYVRARLGDVGYALSSVSLELDGSPVPLGSTAAHDSMQIARES
jgi:putative transposase